MAVRVTYVAIAVGGACGAFAALVGSPNSSQPDAAPLQAPMASLPMRPIAQLARQPRPAQPALVDGAAGYQLIGDDDAVFSLEARAGIRFQRTEVSGQLGIADWLSHGPYHQWTLQRYKCVMGKYIPKGEA